MTVRAAQYICLWTIVGLGCASCAAKRIGDYSLGCDESVGRQISIQMYGGQTGRDPDVSIEQCGRRAIGRVAQTSNGDPTDAATSLRDTSAAARLQRRGIEQQKTALASRYGCGVLRASVEFGEAYEPVSACFQPFTEDRPHWPRLVGRIDDFLRQRPDTGTSETSLMRCIRSGEGRQWVITVWHKRRAEALIVTSRCPWSSPEGLRYASAGTGLLDSVQALIAR